MHAGQLAVVRLGDVDVERLALVDEGAAVGGHLEHRLLGDLPHRLIESLQVSRDTGDGLEGAESGGRSHVNTHTHTDTTFWFRVSE